MTAPPFEAEVTPLAASRAWAARALAIAEHYERREAAEPGMGAIEAHIRGAGTQQFQAAQMASFMALVSLAEDIRAIRLVLCEADGELHRRDGTGPLSFEIPVVDAEIADDDGPPQGT